MKDLRAKGEIKRDIKPKISKEKVKLKDTAKITAIAYTKDTFADGKIQIEREKIEEEKN